jgi:DNA methylase
MTSLNERVRRGEAAIAAAKAKGRDVRDWEKHLEKLKRQDDVQCAIANPYYSDSLCTIINADCRDVMEALPRGLVVTDPPYNVGYHYDEYDDHLTTEGYLALIRTTCSPPCVLIHYPEALYPIARALQQDPTRQTSWVYPSNTPRQHRAIAWFGCTPDFRKDGQPYRNPQDSRIAKRIAAGQEARLYDWWEINQVKNTSSEKTDHPCQIPVEVMRRILKITDCELVIDPFAGSGTTLAAAKDLGIRSIGIERNPKYCKIAADRVKAVCPSGAQRPTIAPYSLDELRILRDKDDQSLVDLHQVKIVFGGGRVLQ